MSQIASGIANQVDAIADKNASLAGLEPELGASIHAVANLAAKVVMVYGEQLLAKLLKTTPAAPAPVAPAPTVP